MLDAEMAQDTFAAVRVAQGLVPADLLLKNCRLVNVYSLEIHPAEIAIYGSRIVAVRENFSGAAAKIIDCGGSYAIPGFVQLELGGVSDSPCVSAWISISSSSRTADVSRHGGSRRSGRLQTPESARHIANLRICSTLDDAIATLRSGSAVFLAPQSDIDASHILIAMRGRGIDTSRLCLQLPHAADVSHLLCSALRGSFTAPEIFQMLSLNPARHYALDHHLGTIAPARQADILLAKSLDPFEPSSILFDGQFIFHEGHPCA